MVRLFIADVHLSEARPDISQHFLCFLRDKAKESRELYVLGDLFDAWIGDDLESPFVDNIRQALRDLTQEGTALFIQHGNRDFLLGQAFADASGAQLLPETYCLELGSHRALLLHGDLLCTDDLEYQQARQVLRSPEFIADFLRRPIPERQRVAAEYRRRSGEVTSLKAQDIMDVNADTLEAYRQRHGADLVIHGHTHRPGVYPMRGQPQDRQRIVLGDWQPGGTRYLQVDETGQYQLRDYP
jgi:UDP-2,3-diacylglucosamine hydrolase